MKVNLRALLKKECNTCKELKEEIQYLRRLVEKLMERKGLILPEVGEEEEQNSNQESEAEGVEYWGI